MFEKVRFELFLMSTHSLLLYALKSLNTSNRVMFYEKLVLIHFNGME